MNRLVEYDQKIIRLIDSTRYDEALWVAEEELYFAESAYGREHLETAKVLNNLGWINDMLGNYTDAESQYLQALEVKISVCGSDSAELIPTLENLVGLYQTVKNRTNQRLFLKKLIELVAAQNKLYRLRKSVYLCQLADVEDELGFTEKAELLLWEALSFLQSHYGFEHPNTARVFAKLAAYYEKHANLARAEYCYNRALRLLRKHLPDRHPDVKFVRDGLSNIYSELGIGVKFP